MSLISKKPHVGRHVGMVDESNKHWTLRGETHDWITVATMIVSFATSRHGTLSGCSERLIMMWRTWSYCAACCSSPSRRRVPFALIWNSEGCDTLQPFDDLDEKELSMNMLRWMIFVVQVCVHPIMRMQFKCCYCFFLCCNTFWTTIEC